MALKPKTAVLQVRIDAGLLKLFQEQCAQLDYVPSQLVRSWIRNSSDAWLKKGIGAVSEAGEGVDTSEVGKAPPAPVPGPVRGAV